MEAQTSGCDRYQKFGSGPATRGARSRYDPPDQATEFTTFGRDIGEVHLERIRSAQNARLNDIIVEPSEISGSQEGLLKPVTLNGRHFS